MLNWIFQKMGKTLEHRQMSSPGNPSGEGFQADPVPVLVAVSVAGQDLPPVLIDVRTEGEFAAGHLHGAHLLPLDRFTEGIEALVPHKQQPVVVYCRSGARSGAAVNWMHQHGYTQARNGGGIGTLALELQCPIDRA